MRKASDILLLIGGILSIFSVVLYTIAGIVFMIFTGSEYTAEIAKGIRENKINTSFSGTPEEAAKYIQVLFLVLGVLFIIFGVMSIVNAVVAFVGKSKGKTSWYVLNIVFAVLSSVTLNLVGGILGIVAVNKNAPPRQELSDN